jgi:hypothetical protein
MTERKLIIEDLALGYEGYFEAKELYRMINDWLKAKNYDLLEAKNYEYVSENGKTIEIEMVPWKKITEYAKYEIKLKIKMENLKEEVINIDNIKKLMNKGKVKIAFKAYFTTDYEDVWEGKPWMFIFRTLVDKFVIPSYIGKWEDGLVKDINELHTEIKTFLNLYHYKGQKAVTKPTIDYSGEIVDTTSINPTQY